jgi:acyl-CoA reductase-like NAD-dependent aldehyde dehydrogenase
LLQKPWAKVLFTGSERVGKLVAQACATTLTPCILELGGKSATVVDESVPASQLQNVADRIVFAKLFNCGQVCVAPDTLFVHESHSEALQTALVRAVKSQFGADPRTGELARIVNTQNAQRLVDMIQEVEQLISSFSSNNDEDNNNKNNNNRDARKMTSSQTKIILGSSKQCDVNDRYVSPTIVVNPPDTSRLLREEVFGPILPVVTFSERQEAIERIQQLTKTAGIPLFLYVFTTREDVFRAFTDKCRSGGAVRSDVLIQLANTEQPLGGLGSSGYGRYFGKYSFDAFTHKYPVTYRPLGSIWDFGNLRCHPYEGWKAKVLEEYLLYLPKIPAFFSPRRLIVFGVFAVAAISVARPMLYYSDHEESMKLRLASTLESMAARLRSNS